MVSVSKTMVPLTKEKAAALLAGAPEKMASLLSGSLIRPWPTERNRSLWELLLAPEVFRLKSFADGAAATAVARRATEAKNFILGGR